MLFLQIACLMSELMTDMQWRALVSLIVIRGGSSVTSVLVASMLEGLDQDFKHLVLVRCQSLWLDHMLAPPIR